MNNQEAFDIVVNHLLTQNEKSTLGVSPWNNNNCRYRAPSGLKCAIGALIPDKLYRSDIEGRPVEQLPDDILRLFVSVDLLLLSDLQTVHDRTPVYAWREQLEHIREEYNLKWNFDDKSS